MTKNSLFFLALSTFFVIVLLILVGFSLRESEDSIHFQTVINGENSGITKPQRLVIKTQEEWQTLWKKHSALEPNSPPHVDFTRNMVIAVFKGETNWSVPPKIKKVEKREGFLLVTIDESLPPSSYLGPAAPFAQPFHIIRLERNTLPVRFETTSSS